MASVVHRGVDKRPLAIGGDKPLEPGCRSVEHQCTYGLPIVLVCKVSQETNHIKTPFPLVEVKTPLVTRAGISP